MKIYRFELMLERYKQGNIDGAKALMLEHIDEYLHLTNANNCGVPIGEVPELSCFRASMPEIEITTEKKTTPIIFEDKGVLLNLVGINRNFSYFIEMNQETPESIELPNPLLKNQVIVPESKFTRLIKILTGRNKVSLTSPSIPKTIRVSRDNIPSKFHATTYWLRTQFTEILDKVNTKYRSIEIPQDLKTYRLLHNQNTAGFTISVSDNPLEFDLASRSIGIRGYFKCYAIKLTDLGVGALYTAVELIAKKDLINRTFQERGPWEAI